MTTGRDDWRSLQSVMIATLHVAAVAYVIRTFLRPTGSPALVFIWVPLTIAVAVFLSWPLARGLARAFDPGEQPNEPACPKCGRTSLRPLIRPGHGLFAEVSGYRCSNCGSTIRRVNHAIVEEPAISNDGPIDPAGIEFLSGEATEGEIQFLDES